MTDLHIFFESGAVGDTALNLCRANIAMKNRGHNGVIVHTSPIFRFGEPKIEVPANPVVLEIWKRCNFITDIIYDVDYRQPDSFKFSKKCGVIIEEPVEGREQHDIRDWIDLRDFTPSTINGPIALFQPISLKMKPLNHLEDYIPIWDRCLKTLLDQNYQIFMVGAKEDPFHLCMNKKFIPLVNNKIGQWSILEALAFNLYQTNVVVSCDSWSGIWGIAAQKKTAIAWGYRMENNLDWWVTNFLGNRNCYKYGWSSQKKYCDALLAAYLGEK